MNDEQEAAQDAQLDLLSGFWNELEGGDPLAAELEGLEDFEGDNGLELLLDEDQAREEARIKGFFEDSKENTAVKRRQSDEGVSRKVNVGLYPSDAKLLEELYEQSKRAGLKNVSRARILRVALRHFHTCWLNQR
jgi:hypothetical protein